MRARLLASACAAAACLALPAIAGASSVYESGSPGALTLHFDAAPGEANNADTSLTGGVFDVKDPGATITPGLNCSPVNPKNVTCLSSGVVGIDALLGDLDDQFVVTAAVPSTIDAGPGNDGIGTGPASGDVIMGGDGDDVIEGGLGADSIQGGPGSDSVYYAARLAAVIADLDGVADDGEAGENDAIALDVENIWSGAGNDTLTGSAGPNWLYGGAGSDVIDGGAGADTVQADVGADTVYARDGFADNIQCGTEVDTVEADPLDVVNADCENVTVAAFVPPPPPPPPPPSDPAPADPVPADPPPATPPAPPAPPVAVAPAITVPSISSAPLRLTSAGVLPVTVGCPATAEGGCSGYMLVELARPAKGASAARRGRPALAKKKKFTVARGKSLVIKVKVSRRGRKELRKRRSRVKVSVYMRKATGGYTKTSKVLAVRS